MRTVDDTTVWSRSFDREISDIFDVQDEIARLEVIARGAARHAQPVDPCERRQDLFGQPLGEKLLVRRSAVGLEWEHRDRG